jgi:hypothetical protein
MGSAATGTSQIVAVRSSDAVMARRPSPLNVTCQGIQRGLVELVPTLTNRTEEGRSSTTPD